MGMYERVTEKTASVKAILKTAFNDDNSRIQRIINESAIKLPVSMGLISALTGTGQHGLSEGIREGAKGLSMGLGVGLGGLGGSNAARYVSEQLAGPSSGYNDAASILGGLLGATGLAYLSYKPFEQADKIRDMKRLKEMQDLARDLKVDQK